MKDLILTACRIAGVELGDIGFSWKESIQIFHYTRCVAPKRVTSLLNPSPRHCTRATQLLLKKCRSCREPLATLCRI